MEILPYYLLERQFVGIDPIPKVPSSRRERGLGRYDHLFFEIQGVVNFSKTN